MRRARSRIGWAGQVGVILAAALLAFASAAGAAQHAPARYAAGSASPALTGLVRAMGASAADATDRRYAYLRKLDSHLQNLESDRLEGDNLAATARREALTLSDAQQRVLVDVYVKGDMAQARDALRAHGMEIAAVSNRRPQRMVEGTLPIAALTDVAGLAGTRAVLAVQGFGTNAGSVLSQGDAAHRGPQARALGPTGAGIPVGIVSNSISRVGGGVADSQATGDLPAQVQVLLDGTPGSNDEGRAMAEIVYDTAPGIGTMLFSTGTGGAATRASGIDNLVSGGARIIADDVFQITEPFFQDGIVAQAVDRAKAAGVTYLVSAGNRARQSWEGTYAPTTDPRAVSPSANDFDTGAAADAIQTIGEFTNRTFFISMQWDEPFGQASTDLAVDVFAINAGTPTYAFTVDTDNLATQIPSEFVQVVVTGTVSVGISIRRTAGARDPFIKTIVGGVPTGPIAEHATNSGAIDPDASSARGALTVAASNFGTPATPEGFSSRGPAFKRFDVAGNRFAVPENRDKPDLAGADGVATSVPGFNPFFGTSAAAPSAAGVAALVLSAKPSLTADQMVAILKDTRHTVDCTETIGLPDLDCGFGFELADGQVAAALDASPPAVSPTTTPAAPNGANGWFTTPSVGVDWTTTDAESPITARSGCDAAGVSADGTATITCSATSIGGTTTQSATINHDASPPSAPTFSGIAAQTYTPAQLPAAAAVGCSASDPTSGVTACAVSGYSAALGPHTLTATASNGAGLTSTSTLAYVVASATLPNAISALRTAGGTRKVAAIIRFGVKATVRAASANTKLKISVKLRGRTVGTQTRTVRNGVARLKIRLQRSGRARLRARPGTLTLTVTGSAKSFKTKRLTAKIKTKR